MRDAVEMIIEGKGERNVEVEVKKQKSLPDSEKEGNKVDNRRGPKLVGFKLQEKSNLASTTFHKNLYRTSEVAVF